MNFLKLSLCVMLIINFFGIYTCNETSPLLSFARNYDLTTLQGQHDFLKKSLEQYEASKEDSVKHEKLLDRIAGMSKSGDFLLRALVAVDKISREDAICLQKKRDNNQEVCVRLWCCCPSLFFLCRTSLYVGEIEEEARLALESLEDLIPMEERS